MYIYIYKNYIIKFQYINKNDATISNWSKCPVSIVTLVAYHPNSRADYEY